MKACDRYYVYMLIYIYMLIFAYMIIKYSMDLKYDAMCYKNMCKSLVHTLSEQVPSEQFKSIFRPESILRFML